MINVTATGDKRRWTNEPNLRTTTGIIEVTLRADKDLEQSHEEHERTTATHAGQGRSDLGACRTIAAGHDGRDLEREEEDVGKY